MSQEKSQPISGGAVVGGPHEKHPGFVKMILKTQHGKHPWVEKWATAYEQGWITVNTWQQYVAKALIAGHAPDLTVVLQEVTVDEIKAAQGSGEGLNLPMFSTAGQALQWAIKNKVNPDVALKGFQPVEKKKKQPPKYYYYSPSYTDKTNGAGDLQKAEEPTPPPGSFDVKTLTFDKMRALMKSWIRYGPHHDVKRFWDVMTALRGPDTPSERPDMTPKEAAEAYAGRRARKYKTVEVIRNAAFYGTVGGAARSHSADFITLPPKGKWDHFDGHCFKAANALGLKVKYEGEEQVSGAEKPIIKQSLTSLMAEMNEEANDVNDSGTSSASSQW